MPINPLGNRQAAYDDFIQGCVKHFGSRGQRCIETEKDRFDMTLRQPQSMQVSYRISFGHFFDFKCT
jgi:prolyl 4-hydroxylase